MVDRRATGPAGSAFVVLPQPDCELVQVQEPSGLLIPGEVLHRDIELRKKFRIVGRHFDFQYRNFQAGTGCCRTAYFALEHAPRCCLENEK